MSLYRMSNENFDKLEDRLRECPCPVNANNFTPDLDVIREAVLSDKQYCMFLIWYQAVIPLNEITRKCHEKVWDEINERILLC